MSDDAAVIDAIFARHGARGPWVPLAATGIANRIYATDDVVLRVAVGSEESISDARTESIASPAGVMTPSLLAFDDSRKLIDRPYSLWERIHGVTVGVAFPGATAGPELWRAVGRELAKLHLGVRAVDDPRGWLDEPSHGTPRALLPTLVELGRLDVVLAQRIDSWLARLEPALAAAPAPRFLHDDLHDKNLMATAGGALLALIDWGDAGWGDPALDFASMPLAAVPFAREAYEAVAPGLLGDELEARMLWNRADGALGRLERDPRRTGKLRELLPLIG